MRFGDPGGIRTYVGRKGCERHNHLFRFYARQDGIEAKIEMTYLPRGVVRPIPLYMAAMTKGGLISQRAVHTRHLPAAHTYVITKQAY